MKPDEPLTIDAFAPLSALVKGYELKPGHAYLIVLDKEHFNAGLASALMRDIRQMHPDVEIAVVATPKSRAIHVRIKSPNQPEESESVESESVVDPPPQEQH